MGFRYVFVGASDAKAVGLILPSQVFKRIKDTPFLGSVGLLLALFALAASDA